MKLCAACDYPICDFCQFYAYNGDDYRTESGRVIKNTIYLGRGRCEHPQHPHDMDPSGVCDDFTCFQLPPEPGSFPPGSAARPPVLWKQAEAK